jgi:hypothetical protein
MHLICLVPLAARNAHCRCGRQHLFSTDDSALPVRSTAWYPKSLPTFSDAIAWRACFCGKRLFSMSLSDPDMVKVSRCVVTRLTDVLCYAT